MSAVAGLQQRFQHAVLTESRTPGLFVDEEVKKIGGFDLYLGAYRARLLEALRDNFTVLHRALGDEAFSELAHTYIAENPSRFRSIRWFGHALPAFLDAHMALLPHPALADLARMDWVLRGAFDAPDAASLTLAELGKLPPDAWPSHRFALLPSVDFVELTWAVEPIWRALNADPEAQTDAPEPGAHTLLVWRPGLDCQWRAVDAVEAGALRALQRGDTFAECCAVIAAGVEQGREQRQDQDQAQGHDSAAIAVGFLQRWIVDGVLSAN